MAKESPNQVRTINVSPLFADMLADLSRAAGESVREFCDREIAPVLRPQLKKLIREKAKQYETGNPVA